eukprot:TRINITY_DN2967_c0_g1_i2.p1 TRINITY_DN2967_c0_g1~~TRINITY_DN2967_c0_g1_i2.p1  ORF type:complete len:926 (-),score=269.09 TRINITY_DN2967_c0_g1_i2:2602-5379(-)
MNLQYHQTLVPPAAKINRVCGVVWSKDRRLAVATADGKINIYDDNGTRVDRFNTRPADPNQPKYAVKAIMFSPDNNRLAVAQTDNILFVYKFGEKKTICNKFVVQSPVTAIAWGARQDDVVFGTAEGKVRVGHLRSNKMETLYNGNSHVCAIAGCPDRSKLVVGHLDGVLTLLSYVGGSLQKEKLGKHTSVPTAIAYGEHVAVGGNDQEVAFYNEFGQVQQKFSYAHDDTEKAYTVAAASPSGQSIVFASYCRLRVFSYSLSQKQWEESSVLDIPNLYTVTTMSFKCDGSKLTLGSLCGTVELYNASIRQYRYKGKYLVTYVSPGQVLVRRLATGQQLMLCTALPLEITRVAVQQDRFVVGFTAESIVCGDIASNLVSEVQCSVTGTEKFIFDNPKVCMVFNAGELTLIEYGAARQPLASIRTDHVNPHLISVRLIENVSVTQGDKEEFEVSKKIAYLIDTHTIHIQDLQNRSLIATINHDITIEWLALDARGRKLLYRDKRRMLHMFDIQTQQGSSLLNYCTYAQWIPESDVVVAQNRNNLCIWYSTDTPERVTMIPINGDVIDVARSDKKIEVLIDEGTTQTSVALNENLIAFGSALEDKQYERAVELLESMREREGAPLTPEVEAMWRNLAVVTLQERQLLLAERCYAALNNVSRARFLRKLNTKIASGECSLDSVPVAVDMDILEHNFKKAEYTLLSHDKIDEAISMYCELYKFDEALTVADTKNSPNAEQLHSTYAKWLSDTGQEEKAAQLKEREGDVYAAVELYLKGGLPARAAQLVAENQLFGNAGLTQQIAQALFKAGLYEKAGDFYVQLNMNEQALQVYIMGRAFRSAVELCRKAFPDKVKTIESEWAEWLVSQRQQEASVPHFIEAGLYTQAIDAAVDAKQWPRALEITDKLSDKCAFTRLAYFTFSMSQLPIAT